MTGRLNVMGIDPGKTVGIAVWLGQTPWHASMIKHYQLERNSALNLISAWTRESMMSGIPTLIGCETFTPRRGRNTVMTTQNDALEIIGAVKVYADATKATLSMQSPALAKRAIDNATLKKFGWWMSDVDWRHANDAARHIGGALLVHYPQILMSMHEYANKTTEKVDNGTSEL